MDPNAACEVVAHRGASAYAPEHTFAAYDLALAQGADRLELDLRISADGRLVVLHDPSLLRTTGDPQRIARIPLAALATIDPVRRPLTFEAVLDRYGSSTRWLVELKGSTPSWESRVADLIAERGLADRAVVQSFDPFALLRLRRRAPAITVAPLFRRAPGAARLRSIAGFAAAIGVCHAAVETLLVSRAHACGLGVRAWTANTPADLERLVAIGVDGVITDAPDVARRLVDAGPLRAAA